MNPNSTSFLPVGTEFKAINNKKESWDTLPFDIFMEYMLKLLTFKDICKLSMVSKSFNDYYSEPLIWRSFYISETVRNFYPKKLTSVLKKCTYKNLEKGHVKIPLVIKNESGIPFNVYWIKQTPLFPNTSFDNIGDDPQVKYECMKVNKTIEPGEVLIFRTYENHRWMLIPTTTWLSENTYFNVGFGFHINVNFLEEYKLNSKDTEKKLTYVKRIHQPKKLKPIRYTNPNIKNFKHMFMKCVINEADFIREIKYKTEVNEDLRKGIQVYKKQIKFNENEIKDNIKTRKALKYALSVCENVKYY